MRSRTLIQLRFTALQAKLGLREMRQKIGSCRSTRSVHVTMARWPARCATHRYRFAGIAAVENAVQTFVDDPRNVD
jgi:hypothetical protein